MLDKAFANEKLIDSFPPLLIIFFLEDFFLEDFFLEDFFFF
jgi:hypothetical protein